MKHSRSRLFLVIIFCILTLPSIVGAADAKNYCHEALSNTDILLKNSKRKATERGYRDLAEFLTKVVEIIEVDKNGQTALMYAAQHGDVNFILKAVKRKLMPRNSKIEAVARYYFYLYINSVDTNGKTALMYAAEKGHKDAVITLIRATADINIKENNKTASTHAAENGHHDIAEMLARKDILGELGGISYLFD